MSNISSSGTSNHPPFDLLEYTLNIFSISEQAKEVQEWIPCAKFPNIWALRLVRQLLFWHPEDRLSVDEAMQHPYFRPHHRT
ncbi:putative inactive protein kinase [Acorus calamus]|uniref:Inactive protein kinase n=1 Tax=Acorus calamus TaxID=4465 RepID=A0AAV9CIL0_ACOCL|nr:putative inactive protein kinase [Acorus calamus]